MVEEKMEKETSRKLKIENLTRCMNCKGFVGCKETMKEDVVDCDHFIELPEDKQVVVVRLEEWCTQTARC